MTKNKDQLADFGVSSVPVTTQRIAAVAVVKPKQFTAYRIPAVERLHVNSGKQHRKLFPEVAVKFFFWTSVKQRRDTDSQQRDNPPPCSIWSAWGWGTRRTSRWRVCRRWGAAPEFTWRPTPPSWRWGRKLWWVRTSVQLCASVSFTICHVALMWDKSWQEGRHVSVNKQNTRRRGNYCNIIIIIIIFIFLKEKNTMPCSEWICKWRVYYINTVGSGQLDQGWASHRRHTPEVTLEQLWLTVTVRFFCDDFLLMSCDVANDFMSALCSETWNMLHGAIMNMFSKKASLVIVTSELSLVNCLKPLVKIQMFFFYWNSKCNNLHSWSSSDVLRLIIAVTRGICHISSSYVLPTCNNFKPAATVC